VSRIDRFYWILAGAIIVGVVVLLMVVYQGGNA
jgi:hypothetical protein